MKKTLLRMGLLCLLLVTTLVAQAQDVTATWDWQNDVPSGIIAATNIQGTTGTVASDVDGIVLTVDATSGKLQGRTQKDAQFNQGTKIQVPVKRAKDEVTVVSYPNYHNYTIGGTAAAADEVTHSATTAEATQGYVEIVATGSSYLYSIKVVQKSAIQEKELFYTNFTDWTDASAATSESTVTKSTKYSHETLSFSIYNTQIKSTNGNTEKFPDWTGGYAMASKAADPYITTSALASITKVHFKHGATGNNRGWKLECKGDGDTDWVTLSSAVADPRTGADVDVDVNRTNVQLRFTNLTTNQNAYLFELTIYGNVDMGNAPILDSFTANGTKYSAADIFEEKDENTQTATVELSKTVSMISTDNPLTATAANGEVGVVTYEATSTQCVATIPVTYNSTTVNYVVTFVQKPDYTLTYYNTDGTALGTQTVEKDATISAFAKSESDVTVADGYKFRGWFVSADGGRKYTTDEVITANTALYAVATEIETAKESNRLSYTLTDQYFYTDDHECFTSTGGKYHGTQHGWTWSTGGTLKLTVAKHAYIVLGLCQYSSGDITATDAGSFSQTITAKGSKDGVTTVVEYTGEGGELTLTFGATAYLHSVTIINDANSEIQKGDANYYVVKAGDADNFLATLAVAQANASTDSRTYIFLPNGTYDLGSATLTQISADKVSIIGQSTDCVVIKNLPEAEGIAITGTLYNTSNNLYLQDLTLQNAFDYYSSGSAGRAVCLHDKGAKTIAKNVKMLSYQDTYYSNAAAQFYFEDSEIHGTVDYLCGDGDVYYNRCTFVNESRKKDVENGECVIAAPNTTTTWGYVMNDCTIKTLSSTFSLARAWNNKPRVAYLNTIIQEPTKIQSNRFTTGGMNVVADKFKEYNSVDGEGNVVSPASNVLTFTKDKNSNEMETILTAEEAAGYALDKVFTDWTPATLAAQVVMSDVTIDGTSLTWNAVEGAQAYAVFVGDELQGITTDATFTLNSTPAEDATVSVRAANSMGGFGTAKVATSASGIQGISEGASNVTAITYYTTNGMQVSAPQTGVNIRVKTLANGKTIAEKVIMQ